MQLRLLNFWEFMTQGQTRGPFLECQESGGLPRTESPGPEVQSRNALTKIA